MKTPNRYRENAKRCRQLLDRPVAPELKIQLRLWAAEFDYMATRLSAERKRRRERNTHDHRKTGSGRLRLNRR
jgi:hypothetical protein